MRAFFKIKIFSMHATLVLMTAGTSVFLSSCEDNPLQTPENIPERTQKDIKRGNITKAVNDLTNPPKPDCTQCEDTSPRRNTGVLNWESYKSNSSTSIRGGIPVDDTPYGRVEWYNGTKRSLPGGGGMRNSKGNKYLDRSILDIMPYVALAHKELGMPTRMAHTTDGTHSTNSLHYKGRAIDIDPLPDSKRRAAYNKIIEKLSSTVDPSTGKPIGCGYFVYDEHSHIHVSYKGPNYGGCPGKKIK